MKNVTDLEQAKLLQDILPHETADMCYTTTIHGGKHIEYKLASIERKQWREDLFAWSLAALIDILPETVNEGTQYYGKLEITKTHVGYYGAFEQALFIFESDSIVDNCVNMIIELHNRKLL